MMIPEFETQQQWKVRNAGSVTSYSQIKSVTKCWMVEPFLLFVFQDSKTQSSIISTAARDETSTSTQILSVANSYVNVKTAKQKIAFPLMAGEIISCLPSAPTSRPSNRSHWCWATLTSMIWLASGRFPTAADSASQPKVTIGKLLVMRSLCGS